MDRFQCLYFLENIDLWIIEIKRTDLAESAELSKRFQWLKIDKQTLEITSLQFTSMDSSEEIQERFFEQGYLKFNALTGTFIEKYNSAQHPLDRRMDFKLTTALSNTISEFLS